MLVSLNTHARSVEPEKSPSFAKSAALVGTSVASLYFTQDYLRSAAINFGLRLIDVAEYPRDYCTWRSVNDLVSRQTRTAIFALLISLGCYQVVKMTVQSLREDFRPQSDR